MPSFGLLRTIAARFTGVKQAAIGRCGMVPGMATFRTFSEHLGIRVPKGTKDRIEKIVESKSGAEDPRSVSEWLRRMVLRAVARAERSA